jgi:biotin transport system substrate-specific component
VLFYLLVGVIGAPVYSDGGSGWEVLSGTNAGYLFGFAIAAWVAGWLAQKRWDRRFSSAVAAMLTGQVIIYACGLAWLAYELGTSFDRTLELGLYPFIPGAVVKIYLAAALLPGAWTLISRLRRDEERPGRR